MKCPSVLLYLSLALSGCAQNTAIVPAVNEAANRTTWYNWDARLAATLERNKKVKPDLVLMGDSITHGWGGEPFWRTGTTDPATGQATFDKLFAGLAVTNMGCSGDKTQHVLYRIAHGSLDGIAPKAIMLMIGTNNIGSNTVDEIGEGVGAILNAIRGKCPKTQILLLAVFPRDVPLSKARGQVDQLNRLIARYHRTENVTFLDINRVFLADDGTIPVDIMRDKLHPTAKGYELWANAVRTPLQKLMGR